MKPNLFQYGCYREFLEDQVTFLKETLGFSIREISSRIGYRSSNYIQLIISGKRNLNDQKILSLASALRLDLPESRFFGHLVKFNQAKVFDEKRIHLKALSNIKAFGRENPEEANSVHYYSHWYFIAVRELVPMKDFKNCPFWISNKLRNAITADEAQEAMKFLLETEMIAEDQEGRFYQSEKTVIPSGRIAISALKDFHKNMINKGVDSLFELKGSERNISCVTIPVNAEGKKRIEMLLTQLQSELLGISENCENSDELLQVNFQMYPLTSGKKQGGENAA